MKADVAPNPVIQRRGGVLPMLALQYSAARWNDGKGKPARRCAVRCLAVGRALLGLRTSS